MVKYSLDIGSTIYTVDRNNNIEEIKIHNIIISHNPKEIDKFELIATGKIETSINIKYLNDGKYHGDIMYFTSKELIEKNNLKDMEYMKETYEENKKTLVKELISIFVGSNKSIVDMANYISINKERLQLSDYIINSLLSFKLKDNRQSILADPKCEQILNNKELYDAYIVVGVMLDKFHNIVVLCYNNN